MAEWSIHWGQCLGSFLRCPSISQEMVYSVSWCHYLCLFPAEASLPATPLLPLEDHASEEVPVTSQLRGPTQVRHCSPFLRIHVHSLPQNSTQTFVCWVSVVLCPMGVYTFSTTQCHFWSSRRWQSQNMCLNQRRDVMVTWVAMSLWLTQHRR